MSRATFQTEVFSESRGPPELLTDNVFARTVASKARGDWHSLEGSEATSRQSKKKKKKYPAFKPLFIEEPINNPSIANAHICYEYDAQYHESEKHWNGSGAAFSKQPRFEKPPEVPGGPSKPVEFPCFFEQPQKVFGRQRKIRPFARAQVYTRPLERPPGEVQLSNK